MNTIKRIYASALVSVLGFFDRGVDRVVRSLTSISLQLDREIARNEAVIDSTARLVTASYDRQFKAAEAERSLRAKAGGREDTAFDNLNRAKRVRERIAALLD